MKKILLILLTLLYSFTIFAAPIKAADEGSTWYNQDPKSWFTKVYDASNPSEIFGERYTAAQVQWIFYSILFLPFSLAKPGVSCFASGDIGTCIQALVAQADSEPTVAQAPLPSLPQQIFADRPLSGITYFKNIFRKFHIIPEAQAQTAGFGFNALDPILPIWRDSRNIAYVILILVTIVMAFMIMFRVKISPQVVISVQSALPKVITAIILITFSYAIAGLLVDLMYVVIGLVSLLFSNNFGFGMQASGIFNILTTGQPLGGINIGVLGLSVGYLFLFIIAIQIVIMGAFGVIGTAVLSPVLLILALLLVLIGFVLVIIYIIRIIFMLFKAFTNILLLTIFAPFQILAGTIIPNLGFSTWIRDFAANLSVFVVTGALFLMSFFFLLQSILYTVSGFLGNQVDWNDPASVVGKVFSWAFNMAFGSASPVSVIVHQIANPADRVWPPLLGSGNESSIGLAFLGVSFVLFTLIPRTAEVIQGFISGRQFAYGSAIGETVGGAGLVGRTVGLGSFVLQRGEAIARGAGALRTEIDNWRTRRDRGGTA